jgi:hypothetical protein
MSGEIRRVISGGLPKMKCAVCYTQSQMLNTCFWIKQPIKVWSVVGYGQWTPWYIVFCLYHNLTCCNWHCLSILISLVIRCILHKKTYISNLLCTKLLNAGSVIGQLWNKCYLFQMTDEWWVERFGEWSVVGYRRWNVLCVILSLKC